MTLLGILLSFAAGMLGTLIGGTMAFVLYGIFGLTQVLLSRAGLQSPFFDTYIVNTLFLPCVMFNGMGFASAVAEKKYPGAGKQVDSSLLRFRDPVLILSGGLAGVMGYLLVHLFNLAGLPVDTGALTVLAVGVLGRVLICGLEKPDWNRLKEQLLSWSTWKKTGLLVAACWAGTMLFSRLLPVYNGAFFLSAISLVLVLLSVQIPATHHITLIAGAALFLTGNLYLALLFAFISQIIFFLFGSLFNDRAWTVIDPPAAAITCSTLLLALCF